MFTKCRIKLTATLFATTMVAMAVLPEATLGAGQVARYHEQKTQKAKAETNALANPAQVFAAAAAPGNMNHALAAAVGDAGSAANGMPLATDGDKAAALHAVVHSAAPADAPHKLAIRRALGLTADPADTPKLNAFEQAAQEKLVHPAMHAAAAGAHAATQKLADALLDPNAAITAAAAAGNLAGVIHDATLAAGGAPLRGGPALVANGVAHGMPVASVEDQIAVLTHILGAGPSDDLTALEGALGTNDPVKIGRFLTLARFELVDLPRINTALHGLAGASTTAKLGDILARLNTATRKAKAPYGGFAGGVGAPDIHQALNRAGL